MAENGMETKGMNFTYPGSMETVCTHKLKRSKLRILPDGMELPNELTFHEECVWCGSYGHSTVDCHAYRMWAEECVTLMTKDDPAIIYTLLKSYQRSLRRAIHHINLGSYILIYQMEST